MSLTPGCSFRVWKHRKAQLLVCSTNGIRKDPGRLAALSYDEGSRAFLVREVTYLTFGEFSPCDRICIIASPDLVNITGRGMNEEIMRLEPVLSWQRRRCLYALRRGRVEPVDDDLRLAHLPSLAARNHHVCQCLRIASVSYNGGYYSYGHCPHLLPLSRLSSIRPLYLCLCCFSQHR